MERIIARYKVKPDKALEHEMFIDEVFQELRSQFPGGVRCFVLKLNDGSYIHVAFIENRTRPKSCPGQFSVVSNYDRGAMH